MPYISPQSDDAAQSMTLSRSSCQYNKNAISTAPLPVGVLASRNRAPEGSISLEPKARSKSTLITRHNGSEFAPLQKLKTDPRIPPSVQYTSTGPVTEDSAIYYQLSVMTTHAREDCGRITIHPMSSDWDEEDCPAEHIEHAEEPKQGYNVLDLGPVAQNQLKLDARILGNILPHEAHSSDVLSKRRPEDVQVEPKPIPKQNPIKFSRSAHQNPSVRSVSLNKLRASTPPKAVRFDSSLEQVRLFFRVDVPAAVGTDHSLVDHDNLEVEAPYGDETNKGQKSRCSWELLLPNFPTAVTERLSLPVRVMRVTIPSKRMKLVGNIAVSNIAFHKVVIVRYTLDNWVTSSDIDANFSTTDRFLGHDIFEFNINLADRQNLNARTLMFCVRYSVNGEDYWDNNNSANFQVNFRKTVIPKCHAAGKGILRKYSHCVSSDAMNSSVPVAEAIYSIPEAFKQFARNCHATDADKFKHFVNDSLGKRMPFNGGQSTYTQLLPGLDGES
jgi:hypothetical protein